MRAIELMSAAFNMNNNKKMGKDTMQHTEPEHTLPEEQDGSRKNRLAAKTALKKVLAGNISRQQRCAAVQNSIDTMTCYDRMNHNVAILHGPTTSRSSLPTSWLNRRNLAGSISLHYDRLWQIAYGGKRRKRAGLDPMM